MTITDELLRIYGSRGRAAYFGEDVTMTEHGLQAAYFAQASGASEALIAAALLHDIGHLVEWVPDEISEWRTDAHHELVGSRWLAGRFGPEISEPVRLHVPAKRYLCATEPDYIKHLSAASVHTLELQGGPMSQAEVAAFEAERYADDAVAVRRCDDQGKVAGLTVPGIEHYRTVIERLARA